MPGSGKAAVKQKCLPCPIGFGIAGPVRDDDFALNQIAGLIDGEVDNVLDDSAGKPWMEALVRV